MEPIRITAAFETNKQGPFLYIDGDEKGIQQLVGAIKGKESAAIPLLDSRVFPSARVGILLTNLRVLRTESKNEIRVEGEDLVFAGRPEFIDTIAYSVSTLLLKDDPHFNSDHLHIEYHPDHYFLQQTSIPLVVTIHRAG